jgi:hypothetical protein
VFALRFAVVDRSVAVAACASSRCLRASSSAMCRLNSRLFTSPILSILHKSSYEGLPQSSSGLRPVRFRFLGQTLNGVRPAAVRPYTRKRTFLDDPYQSRSRAVQLVLSVAAAPPPSLPAERPPKQKTAGLWPLLLVLGSSIPPETASGTSPYVVSFLKHAVPAFEPFPTRKIIKDGVLPDVII